VTEAELVTRLEALPGFRALRHTASGLCADVDHIEPAALAATIEALDLRLGAITGTPLGVVGETALVYHFVGLDRIVDVATTTHGNAAPSLALHMRPAAWAEREIHDLFDTDFPGHPDLKPLMRPEGFATGMMRGPMCGASRATPSTGGASRRVVALEPSE
jgi:NADH:ubiquinone oxidoreductase subunit C